MIEKVVEGIIALALAFVAPDYSHHQCFTNQSILFEVPARHPTGFPKTGPVVRKQPNCYATVFATKNDRWDGEVSACTGEPLTNFDYGIAHRTLPCGTYVEVVNPRNGNSVTAMVVDRGPYGAGTPGHDWYVKRKDGEPPPEELCAEINDPECAPRAWRGCVDLLPAVGKAVGIKGRGKVTLRVFKNRKNLRWKKKR